MIGKQPSPGHVGRTDQGYAVIYNNCLGVEGRTCFTLKVIKVEMPILYTDGAKILDDIRGLILQTIDDKTHLDSTVQCGFKPAKYKVVA